MLLKTVWLLFALGCFSAIASSQPRAPSAQPNVVILKPPMVMPGLDRQRTIRLYLPPGYDKSDKRYPVLYMHDGQNLFDAATSYAGEWGVDEALNQLSQSRKLELIAVGIDHGGDKRIAELSPWENPKHRNAEGKAYMEFVVKVVKPYIDRHYRTLSDRENTAIMGSSLGALISHYAIYEYPAVFSKAGLFSPAYWFSTEVYATTAQRALPLDSKLYFAVGGREGRETVGDVNRMVALVRQKSLLKENTFLKVVPDAEHNEAAWRAQFTHAIEWLFGAGK